MTALEHDNAAVPLMIEGAVIGRVMLEDHRFTVDITAPGTELFLKEVLLMNLAESVSLKVEYIPDFEETRPNRGPLNLVKEY